MNGTWSRLRLQLMVLGLVLVSLTAAAVEPSTAPAAWDGAEPPPGVYFYWYEPSFYCGFAPRCQDPARIHLRLARGNQLRVTVTLGEEQLDAYLEDLLRRRDTIQQLIDQGVIELTQNREFENHLARLEEAGVPATAARKRSLGPEAYRQESAELMARLNPGRVFRIRLPLRDLLDRWRAMAKRLPPELLVDPDSQLRLLNELIPGRINRFQADGELAEQLVQVAELARDPGGVRFHGEAASLLQRAARGHYAVRDGWVEALEFTAVYPAGTADSWVTQQGKRLPDFTVTGVWPLIPRAKGQGLTGMVDYLSPNPGYGFITMLPYQYAGGSSYNAFHNAGVRCNLAECPFLPEAWRRAPGIRTPGRPFQNLWIISRGPVSHGCTRLGSGHMSELRQIVPSTTERLEQVVSFRTLPQCYDVFDVDGNGIPEVIGVAYYLAYTCTQDRIPHRVYTANRREPFYRWLYAGELEPAEDGSGMFPLALDCRFAGRRALEGEQHRNVALWEAAYEPERIQFYRTKPVSFESEKGFELNRELRRIGAGYEASRTRLLLK